MDEQLTEARQTCLRVIYEIVKEEQPVRVTDLAAALGVSKPGVHKTLKGLAELGYLEHEHYGDVRLTETGLEAGKEAFDAYKVSYKFLREILDVDADTAREEAASVAAAISKGTRKKLKKWIKKHK